MRLTRRQRDCAVAGLAVLLAAGLASGSGGSRAPVVGALALDLPRAGVGKTVMARLEIKAWSDVAQLRFKIVAVSDCAAAILPATPALVENVTKGDTINIGATFRVTQAKPCLLVAEVVSAEGVNYRMASVFGATLNQGPPAPPDTRPGTTGDGRPTAEFWTSRRLP